MTTQTPSPVLVKRCHKLASLLPRLEQQLARAEAELAEAETWRYSQRVEYVSAAAHALLHAEPVRAMPVREHDLIRCEIDVLRLSLHLGRAELESLTAGTSPAAAS